MIYKIFNKNQIDKAVSYMERLLSQSKFGVVLSISKRHPKRTTNQNRYYWGHIVKTLADELGYLPEEMHEILKHKFLTIDKKIIANGEELETVTITKSTTKLTTAEFNDYVEKIKIWANIDLGILLLNPDEYFEE